MTILKSQTNKISYDEAVTALNSLQTNAITLKKTRKERQKNVHLNLPITRKNFERSGMTMEDLNRMKIIHVSGTKGKGSTCAFCESILRHSGLKTGFYSSPHLVSVTERIRINGKPLEQVFVGYYAWSLQFLTFLRLLWPTRCPMTCRSCSVTRSKRSTSPSCWPKPSEEFTTRSPCLTFSGMSPSKIKKWELSFFECVLWWFGRQF